MTDDLKERLLELCNGHPNATIPWPHRAIHDALARITDLEARLAAMTALHESDVENGTKLALEAINANNERAVLASRIFAAEAGEDALAEALRPFGFFSDEPNTAQQAWEIRYCDRFEDWIDFGDMESARAALAAYEARRMG